MIFEVARLRQASHIQYPYKDTILAGVMNTPNLHIWTHRLWCPDFIVLRQCMTSGWHTPHGMTIPDVAQTVIWDYVGPPTTVWFFSSLSCTLGRLHLHSPEDRFRVMVIPTLSERMSMMIMSECVIYHKQDLFTLEGLVDFISKVQAVGQQESNRAVCEITHYPDVLLITWGNRPCLDTD